MFNNIEDKRVWTNYADIIDAAKKYPKLASKVEEVEKNKALNYNVKTAILDLRDAVNDLITK